WMNGLYDTLCAVVLFPLLVCLGASGKTTDRVTTRVCKCLGDISYPLYMVHYPFIYLYYAWVKNENLTFTESLPGALALVAGSVILAYLCLKLYDEPVRRFLTDRFLRREK
uniref:acyltransferase family protein n=1 Tax=Alistipes putredinis TaxID=28117 RepID=UPI003FD7F8C9